jgi:hypothetical protein
MNDRAGPYQLATADDLAGERPRRMGHCRLQRLFGQGGLGVV